MKLIFKPTRVCQGGGPKYGIVFPLEPDPCLPTQPPFLGFLAHILQRGGASDVSVGGGAETSAGNPYSPMTQVRMVFSSNTYP